MRGLAERRRELIHDPGIDANELVLGAPSKERELLFRGAARGNGTNGERRGNLERRRGAEPRADRNITRDASVELRYAHTFRGELGAYSGHVIPPCSAPPWQSRVELAAS